MARQPDNEGRRVDSKEEHILNVSTDKNRLSNRLSTTLRLTGHSKNSSYHRLEEYDDNTLPTRRPSVILPSLQEKERTFFNLVATGDVSLVKELLQETPGFNINCENFQGVTALHVAVHSHSEAMVEFLLHQKRLDIRDCALHAVRENQPRILAMILDRLKETSSVLEFVGFTHSAEFPDYITPLILAAQCGHYEIIEMLLERNHSITRPHPPRCLCSQVCRRILKEEDALHVATAKLEVYRAISNPAYLCQSSDDPILMAFQLFKELHQCATIHQEFRAAYTQLSRECRTFAVELLGQCRTSSEVDLVLKQREGCDFPGAFIFPRLKLAMQYNQKEFVAHPNTQKVLLLAWRGDWHEWYMRCQLLKGVTVFSRIFMLPAIAAICACAPNTALAQRWRLPINKMINSMAAYLIFLLLIFLESNLDKKHQKRGPPQSGLEIVLVVFVVGHIWNLVRMCMLQGVKTFITCLHNWYDSITHLLFLLTFIFWLSALVEKETSNIPDDLERKYWHHLDSILLAEGFFAVATILAFGRLLLLCQLNYYLGPLQVSLGKMTKDIAKFVVIFFLLILSFTAGLCRLYHYYEGMVQEDATSGSKTQQVNSFINFESTLKTLFWALFCMSPLESADVIIENLPGDKQGTTVINTHHFTETVGYIAFALFEVMSVIVILNMLIATMSNTFTKVIDNVGIEWTFGRTQVYMSYMSQTTLPPPFNLIPTYTGVSSMIEWVRYLCAPSASKKSGWSPMFCCYMEECDDDRTKQEFPTLISQLVQRYFAEKDQKQEESGSQEMDIIRQEIADLKCSSESP